MSSGPEVVLTVVAVGIALAGLIAAQGTAWRREIDSLRKEVRNDIGDLRHELQQEMSSIRERLVRLVVMMDIIRTGMQLPRPVPTEDPETGP